MIILNQEWWDKLHALDEARRVIEQLLEATAHQPTSRDRRSVWAWLKLVFLSKIPSEEIPTIHRERT